MTDAELLVLRTEALNRVIAERDALAEKIASILQILNTP